MQSQQLTEILDDLQLDPAALAAMLGMNPRSVYRWLSGDHHIPDMVVSVLGLLCSGRITVDSFVRARKQLVKKAKKQ